MAPRVISIIGSRPEIVQAAPLSLAYLDLVDEIIVHTGQHYEPGMSDLQIADLRLPLPDYNLGVGARSNGTNVAVAGERITAVLEREKPDAVLVFGGTNAAIAGARAAGGAGIPVIHVEAGLRSYRDEMPEERNRVEIDHLSDMLFAPCMHAGDVLVEEDVEGSVRITGDLLADALEATSDRLPESESGDYVLATVHRNFNTDRPERLRGILACLGAIDCRVILPLHPRTAKALEAAELPIPGNVELRGAVTYTKMLALERDAIAIATDSSGVQREAYLWGVPCITLREETEWAETVKAGWNTLVGVDPEKFRSALEVEPPVTRPTIFGDGRAAERMAESTVSIVADTLAASAA